MKIYITFALFSVLLTGAAAEPDNEVKKGIFPFMGFIYYQDAAVIHNSGERFIRGAILIRPSWLISGSLEHNEVPLAFPEKTLLARLGGVAIDANFNLNEDEDEQEREIIQVVYPHKFNSSQWWFYDITLLKTLLPFNITSVVAPITPHYQRDTNATSCKILVYSRRWYNESEAVLMQLSVEMLYPTTDCGVHFRPETMICGADSDDNKHFRYDSDYCQGNSGGPLLCEGEVTALQTYVNDECRQPHLFQLLAAWEGFVNCGVQERCMDECNETCVVMHKDTPINEIVVPTTTTTVTPNTTEAETLNTVITEFEQTSIVTTEETEATKQAERRSERTDRTSERESENHTEVETKKVTEDNDDVTIPTLTTTAPNTTMTLTTIATSMTATANDKPDEVQATIVVLSSTKITEETRTFERKFDPETVDRQANVEAQQQMVVSKPRNSAGATILTRSVICLLFFLI